MYILRVPILHHMHQVAPYNSYKKSRFYLEIMLHHEKQKFYNSLLVIGNVFVKNNILYKYQVIIMGFFYSFLLCCKILKGTKNI